ncbi:MAG TPA: extracellular solute-binding protein [Aggregatilineales bacterium]|nr:extracellular solute-binding protein [Aggregatilineales bacterium]
MRKLMFLLVSVSLMLGAALGVAAQDPTATPVPPTPTPLPPVAFAQILSEFAGESDNFAGVDPSGVTVTYWHQYNSPSQLATVTGLVNAFNAGNPYGITVNAIAQGNYNDIRTAMNNAIISGDLPNLVAGFNNDALSYDLDGAMVDLTPYYNDAKWGYAGDAGAELNQNIINGFRYEDGRLLGWVNQVSANVLAVNSGMLSALGFEAAPATLAQFKEVACAAATSDLTGAEGGNVQGFPIVADASQFESFVASIGGSIWADGAWNFTNEQSVAVLQLMADMYKEGCAYIPQERFGNTNDFARGLNPMALGSSAGIPIIMGGIESAGNVVENWTVTATPPLAEGEKGALQLFTPGIMMGAGTPEEQLASWIFLRFFTQADVSQQWAEAMSFFPVNLTAAANLTPANPYFGTINDLIASDAVSIYLSPQQLSYGAIREILATGIADVTSGGLDVMEVAQRMTDDAAAALADS